MPAASVSTYVGRFAPSPTGDLHLGSVVAALASWLRAAQAGGQWLVRVEDIDPPREIAGATDRILFDLQRLGLIAQTAPLRQSQHHARYRAALEFLQHAGMAFPCWCSRQQVSAQGGHHGKCATFADAARAPAWRALVPDLKVIFDDQVYGHRTQQLGTEVGDFVLWRQDNLPAYQLAVVVDDAAQGVSEIVRGADLLDSTARQIWLQRVLGFATPQYVHVPLVLGADGQKLSKQTHAPSISQSAPLDVLRDAWVHLQQSPVASCFDQPATWLQEASKRFQLARLRPELVKPG